MVLPNTGREQSLLQVNDRHHGSEPPIDGPEVELRGRE